MLFNKDLIGRQFAVVVGDKTRTAVVTNAGTTLVGTVAGEDGNPIATFSYNPAKYENPVYKPLAWQSGKIVNNEGRTMRFVFGRPINVAIREGIEFLMGNDNDPAPKRSIEDIVSDVLLENPGTETLSDLIGANVAV